MTTTPRIIACPTCHDRVKWMEQNPYRPFCCERCQLIDFGTWVEEENAIVDASAPQDEFGPD